MKRVVLICFLFSIIGFSVYTQSYIKIIKNGTNIRSKPNTNSIVIVTALAGDAFKLVKLEGNWYLITMFSGEYRYVFASLAEKQNEVPSLPSLKEVRKKAFIELVRAQDKAVAESMARYPNDFNKQTTLEYILYDRYELPICRKYSIPPPLYYKLIIEGAKSGWVPKN